jgi:hypothetical protein
MSAVDNISRLKLCMTPNKFDLFIIIPNISIYRSSPTDIGTVKE